jgi:K+-sensing histidine kinase KdpD
MEAAMAAGDAIETEESVPDELDELTQTLKALSEGPSEEQLSLQQFSHDIRTPLSSVKGCLQLLVRRWDRMDDDRRRLLVETAARETERVVNIVARLDETRPAG